jgi:hypothetical protein
MVCLINVRACILVLIDCNNIDPHCSIIWCIFQCCENTTDQVDKTTYGSTGWNMAPRK